MDAAPIASAGVPQYTGTQNQVSWPAAGDAHNLQLCKQRHLSLCILTLVQNAVRHRCCSSGSLAICLGMCHKLQVSAVSVMLPCHYSTHDQPCKHARRPAQHLPSASVQLAYLTRWVWWLAGSKECQTEHWKIHRHAWPRLQTNGLIKVPVSALQASSPGIDTRQLLVDLACPSNAQLATDSDSKAIISISCQRGSFQVSTGTDQCICVT